jgi:hypothetical protein
MQCDLKVPVVIALCFAFPLAVSSQEPPAESKEKAEEKQPSIDDKLARLVKTPDRETFLALRKEVIASKAFKPYSDEMDQANELYEAGKIEAARDLLLKSMDNLMLNPRAHIRLSFYHLKLGDRDASKKEFMIAHACLKGILSTGDGTKDKPYLVLRTDDEYEVLSALKKKSKMQSLQFDGRRKFDVLTCTDDSQIYFDITDFFGKF